MMNISDNPFFTLEVSTRDNRTQITEAADQKAFLNDSVPLNEARTALIIPSKRLGSEVRWFPGIEDKRVREISNFFRRLNSGQPPGRLDTSGLRSLALLNFAVYMFGFRKFGSVQDMTKSILAICRCFDTLNSEGICAVINNDRLIAGFPMIDELELERELNNYRNDILRVIDGRASRLSPDEYLLFMNELAKNYADENGSCYVSQFLNDLLSSCELNILPSLEGKKSKILKTVSRIKFYGPDRFFVELSDGLKEWHKLADPLLTAAKAAGLEDGNIHAQGWEIFGAIRECSITLHNEKHKTLDALKVMQTARVNLYDVSERISETVENDVAELQKLEQIQRQAEEEYNSWAKSLYYETEFGLIFKDKLIISVDGVSWKGRVTPRDEVLGVSWGGITQYLNGHYAGTDYKIAIQTPYETVRLTPNEKKFSEITQHLWQALIDPIVSRILKQLQDGMVLSFGSIKIKDDGVYLKKSGWFSFDTKFFTWGAPLTVGSENGSFYVKAGEYSASSSYIEDMNTHILNAILTQFLRNYKRGHMRLSSMLREA